MAQSLVETLLLFSGSWCCKLLFVLSKTGVSGSPALWKAYNQTLRALKARFAGDSQSLCQIPRLGSLTWGSKWSQQCKNFFDIIIR